MITKEQYANLSYLSIVEYGHFKNVLFHREIHINGIPHIVLKDVEGNEKEIYLDLFLKYGSIVD